MSTGNVAEFAEVYAFAETESEHEVSDSIQLSARTFYI